MKQVLILEDNITHQQLFGEMLGPRVNLLQAFNLQEAEKLFNENKDTLDIVALDGQVPNNGSTFNNTVELAQYIKNNFNGVMYSLTQSRSIKDDFKKIGFTGLLDMKFEFVRVILDILENDKTVTA